MCEAMPMFLSMIKPFYNADKFQNMMEYSLNFEGKWVELENIILSEVTHRERQLSYVLTHRFLNTKQRKPAYKSQS